MNVRELKNQLADVDDDYVIETADDGLVKEADEAEVDHETKTVYIW